MRTGRARAGAVAADRLMQALGLLVLTLILGALAALLYDVLSDGVGRLSWGFLVSYPSRRAEQAGILPALVGSVYVITLTALIAVPLGVGAAVYLEEFGTQRRLARIVHIVFNISCAFSAPILSSNSRARSGAMDSVASVISFRPLS